MDITGASGMHITGQWVKGIFQNKIFHVAQIIYSDWIIEFICLQWGTVKVEKDITN